MSSLKNNSSVEESGILGEFSSFGLQRLVSLGWLFISRAAKKNEEISPNGKSITAKPDRWVVYAVLVPPGPVFPMNKLLANRLLILCSFLRLIIHSPDSSCYRRSALHPCSSHRGLTLKKHWSYAQRMAGSTLTISALPTQLPFTLIGNIEYPWRNDVKIETHKGERNFQNG